MPLGLSSQVFSNTSIVINGMTLRLNPGSTTSYSGSGTTWTDVCGNGANITLVNSPTFTSGTRPYFTFNGTNQYGTGSKTNVLPTTAYTKSVWFYLNAYQDNNLVSSQTGGHFLYMGSATNKLYSGHSNWAVFTSYASTGTISLSTWYMATLTFNTTNGMTLYINGSQDSTYTADKSAHNGDGSTNVATYAGGNLLNGRIGQVFCYNRALSSTEVLQNYNATKSTYGL